MQLLGTSLRKLIIVMQFNGLELSAIVKLAKAMAATDGRIAKEELVVIALDFAKFGVSQTETDSFLAMSDVMEFGHAIALVAAMNNEQKKYVAGYLASIMVADGEIADSEVSLWRLISTLASLQVMNVGEAITFWKNH